jgi:hypothetical protein
MTFELREKGSNEGTPFDVMSVRQIHEPIVFSNETVEIELDANQ